jgi:hypothetical protein
MVMGAPKPGEMPSGNGLYRASGELPSALPLVQIMSKESTED